MMFLRILDDLSLVGLVGVLEDRCCIEAMMLRWGFDFALKR
jgi:hypothetical protein